MKRKTYGRDFGLSLRMVFTGALLGALYVAFAGRNMVVPSVLQLEAFPETYNPGYFVIKLALWVMTAVLIAQAVLDIARTSDRGDG